MHRNHRRDRTPNYFFVPRPRRPREVAAFWLAVIDRSACRLRCPHPRCRPRQPTEPRAPGRRRPAGSPGRRTALLCAAHCCLLVFSVSSCARTVRAHTLREMQVDAFAKVKKSRWQIDARLNERHTSSETQVTCSYPRNSICFTTKAV